MPDATLAASYQAYNDANRRSDKAFTPHPTCFPSNQNNSASPLKKQRFRLSDGLCMEDEQFSVKHYDARVKDGVVQLRG